MAMIAATQQAVTRRIRWTINRDLIKQLFVLLTLVGMLAGIVLDRAATSPALLLAVHVATYVFGGTFAVLAIAAAIRRRQIEVDLLMVLAALGAAYVDAWTEGAILLFLFSLSNVLQRYALRRTEQAIASLLQLRPDTVACRRGDEVVMLRLDNVEPGQIMILRPGDRVALDATIVHGQGSFDESAITGESMPVQKRAGDHIYGGTVNQNGAIDARVTKPAAESTLARMIALVSDARERKARTQSFLETFEQRYAIGVIGSVALYIVLMPLLLGVDFSANFYRAMTLLTVASPCALVIGVPAALLSAIAGAARQGVLFKGGAHLEELARIKVVAIDKTGTITFGSKRARRVVWQNIAFALVVIIVMALSTLSVGVPLPIGVVSHEGSTVIVVMNGLRLLTHRS